jgi:mono/diheme cytochrome c family protein
VRRWILVCALGLVAGVALTLGTRPASGDHESLSTLLPGNPLEGGRLFTGKGCIYCHAVHGVGGTTGPDLGRGMLNRPLLEIAGVMWNHSKGMEHLFKEKRTGRPTFEPEQMASLLSFLHYLGSLDPPGDPAAGARLFREKGCETCHSVGKKGGTSGPELDEYRRYASPLHLTAALWKHGTGMADKMRARRIPRPTFEGNDVAHILAYIRSAGGGTERVYVQPGNPQRGEELFTEKRCVECHAVRGHGGKTGPDLGIRLRGSLVRITGSMWNKGPNMWAAMARRGIDVPSLSTEEMSDLVSYLYFFQFVDPPGDVVRGRAVYREKGCGVCHAATAKPVAPPIAEVVEQLGTPLEAITAMWNHAGEMEGRMAEENVAWPIFSGGEMADLVAYLLSVRSPAGER